LSGYRRYAIFYAPPAGSALGDFGAAWLGWDAEAGERVIHPEIAGLPLPVEELTESPRKYGFHGTLKPPFRLAEGVGQSDISAAIAELAAMLEPFATPPLVLRGLGRFVALVPSRPDAALAALAAESVRRLDHLRAPLSEAELARRRAAGLSAAQEANLTRWGYPYVLEEFRFHLTLTGPVAPEIMAPVLDALAIPTAGFCRTTLPVTEICLFGERDDGFFNLIERLPLTGLH